MCHLTHQEEKKLKDRLVKKQVEGKNKFVCSKTQNMGITGHILMKAS